jgi:predicted MFS family arabinose efflux permease
MTELVDTSPAETRRTLAPVEWIRTLAVIFLSRFVLNLQWRIVYPFLPAIGRGLGVSFETASLLLTARSLVGITSPVYGRIADRDSRRIPMLGGLVALVLGTALAGAAPAFAVALGAFALQGLSKASYDPAAQAYVGDAVPYERRGRIMGILELPWSLAWLIGVPVSALLISRFGWRSPFWVIAGLGAVVLLASWRLCSQCGRGMSKHRATLRSCITGPALMALLVTCLLLLANENIFVVYGAWMEDQFGLTIAALGAASMVIAVAELVAEASSAGLVDRLGKRRSVFFGLALGALSYLLLPMLARNLGSALLGITILVLIFEFTIVSMLPLVSELVPDARGTLMAVNLAAISFGRMLGSLSGPRLWTRGGLWANSLASAAVVTLALLILWIGVREKPS